MNVLHTTASQVRRLDPAEAEAAVQPLSRILVACVEGGASIGFMLPITHLTANDFWSGVVRDVELGRRALLVAEDDAGDIIGTVQLILALPENQPHRADLAKMMVHPRARRLGVAQRLLEAAEQTARAENRTLLVLDAVTDGPAARLYQRAGWQRVGDIPNFALMPDGAPCSTTYFYKQLSPRE